MPRASPRSSARAAFASSWASSTSCRARSGSVSKRSRARPRSIAGATSRCGPVVQVALDALPFRLRAVDGGASTELQLVDSPLEIGALMDTEKPAHHSAVERSESRRHPGREEGKADQPDNKGEDRLAARVDP